MRPVTLVLLLVAVSGACAKVNIEHPKNTGKCRKAVSKRCLVCDKYGSRCVVCTPGYAPDRGGRCHKAQPRTPSGGGKKPGKPSGGGKPADKGKCKPAAARLCLICDGTGTPCGLCIPGYYPDGKGGCKKVPPPRKPTPKPKPSTGKCKPAVAKRCMVCDRSGRLCRLCRPGYTPDGADGCRKATMVRLSGKCRSAAARKWCRACDRSGRRCSLCLRGFALDRSGRCERAAVAPPGKGGKPKPQPKPVPVPPPAVEGWELVGSRGFTAGPLPGKSLAVDPSSGAIYVAGALHDPKQGARDQLVVLRHTAAAPGAWVAAGPTSPQYFVRETNLAINASSGGLLLAYDRYFGARADDVAVWQAPAGSVAGWSQLGASMRAAGPLRLVLALDSGGTPLVGYQEQDSEFRATVMAYRAGGGGGRARWAPLGGQAAFSGPALAGGGELRGFDMAAGPGGRVYIIYLEASPFEDEEGRATAMWYGPETGGQWQLLGNPGLSGGRADSLSLGVDSRDGAPVAAYIDHSSGRRASTMRYSVAGGGWQPLGSLGFSRHSVSQVVLAAGQGSPHVAFSGGEGGRGSVMRYAGGKWHYVGGTPDVTPGAAKSLALALDGQGQPVLAFSDIPASRDRVVREVRGKLTVMRYRSGGKQLRLR